MVYKRYVKRGGKTFGPYYYHSVRSKNGKIKSLYSGKPSESVITLHNLLMLLLIVSVFFAVAILKPTLSGLLVREQAYSALIEESVFQGIEDNGTVRVIVNLKPLNQEINTLSISSESQLSESADEVIEKTQESVQMQQDNVLSILNLDISQGGDFGIASEPDFQLSNRYSNVYAFAGWMNENGLRKLGNNPNVESIYVDRIYTVDSYNVALAYSVPMINATNVWQKQINSVNITGSGQTVCVIDTGIDYTHADLGGGFGNKVIAGHCYGYYDGFCAGGLNESDEAMDDNGHGTHVAGIIAANGEVIGVAPDAKLIAIKVCNSGGSCPGSDILSGFEWCVNNASKYNISVISMSLGGTVKNTNYCDNDMSNPNLTPLVNAAILKGIFVSISSGNSGYTDGIGWPACIQNATAVGAVTKSDGIVYNRWGKSNIVLAPGLDIYSTCLGGGTCSKSGTSMAAPHISGAAALLQQYQRLYSNSNLTPYEMRNIMQTGGVSIYDASSGLTFKRINVLSSLNLIMKINQSENSVEKENTAKITFGTSTDMSNALNAFVVSNNFISLDSVQYPQFNKPATINFYNLPFQKSPIILKDGQVCSSGCSITSYNGNLTFGVTGFSNYSAGNNSNLAVWDSADSGMPFYIGIVRVNDTAFFYANYTNATSNQIIGSATCTIAFDDFSGSMQFNSTKQLLEFNRTFTASGIKSYNISCSHSDFESLFSQDSIEILPSDLNCNYPGSNVDWIINSSTICNNETLFINQSNLIVDNSTLILNNTHLYLIQGSKNFTIYSNGTLNMYDTVIESQVGGYSMNLNSYGRINLQNVTLLKTRFNAYGNSINYLNDSNFFSEASFDGSSINTVENSFFYNYSMPVQIRGNSRNYIKNSFFNNSYITENSYSEFTNSILNISDIGFTFSSGSPSLNFTSTQSTILSINQIRYDAINIYGNVNMPSSIGTWSSGGLGAVVKRFYPVFVYYLNSSIPISNKQVNITDANGNVIWQGITNSQGYAEANITLNKTNYSPGNFTISVNPSSDISFFTDTPIIFELSDTEFPQWSNNKSSTPSVYSPVSSSFNITWTDNNAIDTVFIEGNWSGSSHNYSMSNSGGNYSFSASLPAGDYYWKSHANDTSNNLNSSDSWIFSIAKASSTVTMSFNPASTIIYGNNVSVSCNGELFRNNQNVTSEIGQNKLLGVGSYNYSCKIYGNQNYSYNEFNQTFIVNQANQTANISFSPSSSITYNASVNVSCNGELFRNEENVTSEISHNKILAAGLYNYSCKLYGNQNYSYAEDNDTLTINKASSTIRLLLDGSENGKTITAGNSVNITSYALIPYLERIELFVNGGKINGGTGILTYIPSFPAAGIYNVTSVYNSTQNYSYNFKTFFITVNSISAPQQQTGEGGGGGGGGGGCIESWNCGEWSSCANGMQFRSCTDLNGCGTYVNRPTSNQQCESGASSSSSEQNISRPGQENQPGQLAMPAICDINWLMIAVLLVLSVVNSYLIWRSSRKKEENKNKKKGSKLSLIIRIILFVAIIALVVYLIFQCQNNLIPVIAIAVLLIFYALRVLAFKKMQKSDSDDED